MKLTEYQARIQEVLETISHINNDFWREPELPKSLKQNMGLYLNDAIVALQRARDQIES